MKFVYGLAAALCLFCVVSALPIGSTPEEEEVELIEPLPARRPSGRPVYALVPQFEDDSDFNVGSILIPDYPSGLNFGFVNRLQDLLRNLYGQGGIESSLNPALFPERIPDVESQPDASSDDDVGTPGTHTTSTVKIINGLKYITNETITTQNTPFGVSLFKVRTVKIERVDDDEAASPSSTSTESASTTPAVRVEGADADEDNNRKDVTENIDTTDEEVLDRGSPEVLEPDHRRNEISRRNNIETFEVVPGPEQLANSNAGIDSELVELTPIIQLSHRPTAVVVLSPEQSPHSHRHQQHHRQQHHRQQHQQHHQPQPQHGRQQHHQFESLRQFPIVAQETDDDSGEQVVAPWMQHHHQPAADEYHHHNWAAFETSAPHDDDVAVNSHLDVYETVPPQQQHDLSNDIAINEMLADQAGGPPAIHPDAELFDVQDVREHRGRLQQHAQYAPAGSSASLIK